jgi:hypothetical protein
MYSIVKHDSMFEPIRMRVLLSGSDVPFITGHISMKCDPVLLHCAENRNRYVPVVGITIWLFGYVFPYEEILPSVLLENVMATGVVRGFVELGV